MLNNGAMKMRVGLFNGVSHGKHNGISLMEIYDDLVVQDDVFA